MIFEDELSTIKKVSPALSQRRLSRRVRRYARVKKNVPILACMDVSFIVEMYKMLLDGKPDLTPYTS